MDNHNTHEYFCDLLQTVPGMLYTGYPDWSVKFINNEVETLSGYSLQEFSDKSINWFSLIHPDDKHATQKESLVLNQQPTRLVQVYRIIKKDGTIAWIRDYKVSFFADGKLAYVNGAAFDITREKTFEHELIQQKQQLQIQNSILENRVQVETQKRLDSERMLFEQNKFASISQMFSAIAHHWRQPLTALSFTVASLVDEIKDVAQQPDVVKEYYQDTNRIIANMSKTIDEFSEFFRSSEPDKMFNLVNVLDELLYLHKKQCDAQNIDLRIICSCAHANRIATPLTLAECDCPALFKGHLQEFKQAMLSILTNAVESIAKTNHELLASRRITITVGLKNTTFTIRVHNTGLPANQDVLDRIFNPYFTTKPVGQGMGLNLYITRIIIEQHMNGTITAENTKDGLEFTIRIPVIA